MRWAGQARPGNCSQPGGRRGAGPLERPLGEGRRDQLTVSRAHVCLSVRVPSPSPAAASTLFYEPQADTPCAAKASQMLRSCLWYHLPLLLSNKQVFKSTAVTFELTTATLCFPQQFERPLVQLPPPAGQRLPRRREGARAVCPLGPLLHLQGSRLSDELTHPRFPHP